MNRRERIESLFDGALDRPSAERGEWLEDACADDAELRAEVEALLAAHERAEGILDAGPRVTSSALATALAMASAGLDRVGPYRITGELGRGGMAVVYLGERDDGAFRQRVAIKVIGGGPDPIELRQRLESERRILAALDHPNIARLLDGGITVDGRPYIVMEYVDGTPIDEYCDSRLLTIEERLRLFCTVARTVHYAHRSLIVHRDLKPSNILVTPEGEPKLLDFGIAKILDPARVGDSGPLTRTGLRLMTPEYASPEQVRGEPVTTANDVYALGIVLYELLVGRRPFELTGRSLTECERIILEQQPARPSTRVRTRREGGAAGFAPDEVGRARRTNPERLRRQLRGDIDRIVLQALRKEPHARYGSAEQLAEDIERFLEGLPVAARGSPPGYRARKFLRRHRWGVAATVVLLLSLVGGTVGTAAQARRASRERDRAADEAARAQRVATLMMDLFRLTDPTETLGDTVTARQILDAGTERVIRELGSDPVVQATMLSDIARVYENLGIGDRAETLVRQALELREATLGPGALEVSESLGQLARLLSGRADRAGAVQRYERAIAIREHALPEPDTLLAQYQAALAWEIRSMGRHNEASRLFESALATLRARLGEDAPHVAQTLLGLAATHHEAGRFDEAEAVFERALARFDTAHAAPSPVASTALLNISMIRRLRGRYADAEPLLDKASEMRSALYDADHPAVIETLDQRGALLFDLGRYAESERTLVDGVARASRSLGREHPTTESLRETLANVLTASGRYAEASAEFDTVLAYKRARLGEDHPGVAFTLLRAGDPELLGGNLDRAHERFDEARSRAERVSGERSTYRALALHGLGRLALRRGETETADRLLTEARDVLESNLRPDHRYILAVRQTRATLLLERGDAREALAELESILAAERATLPVPHPNLARTLIPLARAQLALGDATGARRTLREAQPHLAMLPLDHELHREARALAR